MLLPLLVLAFADISGSWVASRPGPGGQPMEIQFTFKQEGGALTGSLLSMMGEQKIVNGKVEGDAVSFEVVMNMMGNERRMKYEGTLIGDELHLTAQAPGGMGPGGPGGPPPGAAPNRGGGSGGPGAPGGPGGFRFGGPMVAKRGVSEALQKQKEADARRPKPTLPELKALPPNDLALTPPMGWNSWNKFAQRIDDGLIRGIADALASSGLKDAGYHYLVIDDGWQNGRDDQGNLRPNSRFPDMKALGDYVHSKGLKFGIYSSPGPRTCGRQEGSYGYEERDAKLFASWGVDFVKYDWCSAGQIFTPAQQPQVFQLFAGALRNSGRPIVYSISQYGQAEVQKWAPSAGANMWRTTGDIRDSWDSMTRIGFGQDGLESFARPGHWNDPDMLEVGNGGLTLDENKTHFTLWCMLASPLILGNDVRSMSKETLQILTNREVIAINQDALGMQGKRVSKRGSTEIWVKDLKGGDVAIALFNRGEAEASISAPLGEAGLEQAVKVRDLWTQEDKGPAKDNLEAKIPAHGVVLFRLSRK